MYNLCRIDLKGGIKMARAKEWTKDKVLGAVKELCERKNIDINELTITDIRDAGLYHAVVSSGGFKKIKGQLLEVAKMLKEFKGKHKTAHDKIRQEIDKYNELRTLEFYKSETKQKTVKKYIKMLLFYNRKYGEFPRSLSKDFRTIYNFIKSNRYILIQFEAVASTLTNINDKDRMKLFEYIDTLNKYKTIDEIETNIENKLKKLKI
jgi:hypothetical protein